MFGRKQRELVAANGRVRHYVSQLAREMEAYDILFAQYGDFAKSIEPTREELRVTKLEVEALKSQLSATKVQNEFMHRQRNAAYALRDAWRKTPREFGLAAAAEELDAALQDPRPPYAQRAAFSRKRPPTPEELLKVLGDA